MLTTNSIRTSTVHPHACGEHADVYPLPYLYSGSSPRVWGTWKDDYRTRVLTRFIPTRVGNIPACAFQRGFGFGSSPRVWGTLSQQVQGLRG